MPFGTPPREDAIRKLHKEKEQSQENTTNKMNQIIQNGQETSEEMQLLKNIQTSAAIADVRNKELFIIKQGVEVLTQLKSQLDNSNSDVKQLSDAIAKTLLVNLASSFGLIGQDQKPPTE